MLKNFFVDLLSSLSDHVVMTAAPPGQGGTDHVNEQPNSYWIEKFRKRGFRYDETLTQRTRTDWKEKGAADFYYRNVMIFARGA